MNLNYLVSILALVVALAVMFGFNIDIGIGNGNGLAAKVAVEIFKSDETGEMIYCESGDLHGSSGHTYMGSGTIDGDLAVAC